MNSSPRQESIARLLRTDRGQAVEMIRWGLRLREHLTPRQKEILAEVIFCESLAEAARNLSISRETLRKSVARLEELIRRALRA